MCIDIYIMCVCVYLFLKFSLFILLKSNFSVRGPMFICTRDVAVRNLFVFWEFQGVAVNSDDEWLTPQKVISQKFEKYS